MVDARHSKKIYRLAGPLEDRSEDVDHGMLLHLALMDRMERKQNMRAFYDMEKDFTHGRNNILCFIFYWYTHEVPVGIEDRLSFVETSISL